MTSCLIRRIHATNHNRRLEKPEEVSEPKGRLVFIWDNHKPGCVEREFARRISEGSASPEDEIVAISWEA
jgi:hypothetical protein